MKARWLAALVKDQLAFREMPPRSAARTILQLRSTETRKDIDRSDLVDSS